MKNRLRTLLLLPILAACMFSALGFSAGAAEVRVMISGGYSTSLASLVPEFERRTGHKVVTIRGPSMGATAEAIPNRLQRGERADVLILVGYALDSLIAAGKASAADRFDLAQTVIVMAVHAGAKHPDIGTVAALKDTLLAAKSIAYSDSASGMYLSTELFPRLGVWEQIKARARMIPAEPVGQVVARGEAEIGFQQLSEMKPVKGIEIVGPLPKDAQKVTVFSGAVATGASDPAAARALLVFLKSPDARDVVTRNGMEPVPEGPAK